MEERATELEQTIDACELASFTHLDRIEQLEQLCKDFWNTLRFEMGSDWIKINRPRMENLGLLEGEQND